MFCENLLLINAHKSKLIQSVFLGSFRDVFGLLSIVRDPSTVASHGQHLRDFRELAEKKGFELIVFFFSNCFRSVIPRQSPAQLDLEIFSELRPGCVRLASRC